MDTQTPAQPTATAPGIQVIIEKTETVEYGETFTLEDLEDYAGTTLAKAGSIDELVERAKDRDTGFYEAVERRGEVADASWTVRLDGETLDEEPAASPEPEVVEPEPEPEHTAETIVALIRELAARDPEGAWDVFNEVEGIARDAEYPRLTVATVPDEDAPDDRDMDRQVLIDPYDGTPTDVVAVDVSVRWTEAQESNDDIDHEGKSVRFDYEGGDHEGLLYLTDGGRPVRLPDGWSEG